MSGRSRRSSTVASPAPSVGVAPPVGGAGEVGYDPGGFGVAGPSVEAGGTGGSGGTGSPRTTGRPTAPAGGPPPVDLGDLDAFAKSLPTMPVDQAIAALYRAPAETQFQIAATRPDIVGLFGRWGVHPIEVLPTLATVHAARLPGVLFTNPVFAHQMLSDPSRVAEVLVHAPPDAAQRWAQALYTLGRFDMLLQLAGSAPDFVNAVNAAGLGLALMHLGGRPAPREQRDGVWALWQGGPKDAGSTRAAFGKLFATAWTPAGTTWTMAQYSGVVSGVAVQIEERITSVEPDAGTLATCLNAMNALPVQHVMAAPQFMFAAERSYFYRPVTKVNGVEIAAGTWQLAAAAGGTPNPEPLKASFYTHDNRIVYKVDKVGPRNGGGYRAEAPLGRGASREEEETVGGAPMSARRDANGKLISKLQATARHEVGHAVGTRKFPGLGSGEAMVVQWAGWEPVKGSDLLDAYWGPSMFVRVTLGGKEHRFFGSEVGEWLLAIVDTGAVPAGHDVTKAADGKVAEMIAAIDVAEPGNQLPTYAKWILENGPKRGYVVDGFDPGPLVYIRSPRNGADYMRYKRGALDALKQKWGWYSLSSPSEMFAEMYTMKYSANLTPPKLGADAEGWFRGLESMPEADFAKAPPGGLTSFSGSQSAAAPVSEVASPGEGFTPTPLPGTPFG